MPIRAKVDEDLPLEIADRLRASGHDACTVLDQRLIGTQDPALWSRVQAEGRWLFTGDKGFADIRAYPPGTHVGVVLLRLPRESRQGYVRLADLLLRTFDFAAAAGAIVVVSPDVIRVHRPKKT